MGKKKASGSHRLYDPPGVLYLLVDSTKPWGVFKVGRTARPPQKRLSEYPKGSMMVSIHTCSHHRESEAMLLRYMGTHFRRYGKGREWFHEDGGEAIAHFANFCRGVSCPMDIG